MKNIVLTGFMGSGKTCVGQIVACELGWDFVDVDAEVEQAIGMTITEYFRQFGEDSFRDREQEAVARVAGREKVVIATGGGVVLRRENVDRLRETGYVVCLSASEAEIIRRTAGDQLRPLLNRPDRLAAIRALLEARMPLYRQADLWVETDGKTAAEIAAALLQIVRRDGLN
jgi:shikimate kinase